MGGSRTNAEKSAQKHGVRLNIFPVVFRALQAFFKFYKPKLLRTIWFALGKINVLEETISNINSIFTNVKDVTIFGREVVSPVSTSSWKDNTIRSVYMSCF